MERLISYDFLIDFENIQHKLSSDYSLSTCFSRRFPFIDGPSFSTYKPLQNVHFWKVGNMQFSFSGIVLTIEKKSGGKFWGYASQNSK